MIADLATQLGDLALCAAPACVLLAVLCCIEWARETLDWYRAEWHDEKLALRIAREYRLGSRERLSVHDVAQRAAERAR